MVMAVRPFERLYRETASLDIDKSAEYTDLHITAGLQKIIRKLNRPNKTNLSTALEKTVGLPQKVEWIYKILL